MSDLIPVLSYLKANSIWFNDQLTRIIQREMSYDAFSTDLKTQDAVIRNLEIIGEAARTLTAYINVSPK